MKFRVSLFASVLLPTATMSNSLLGGLRETVNDAIESVTGAVESVTETVTEMGENLLTLAECVAAVEEIHADPLDFSTFSEIYRNDSQMILAETGIYQGAEAIEEYVRFTTSSSPYLQGVELLNRMVSPTNMILVEEGGLCSHVVGQHYEYHFDPHFADARVEVPILAKVYINPRELYIPKIYIYYPPNFLKYFFGDKLNSTKSREFVCDVIENGCGFTQWDNTSSCLERLNQLPLANNEVFLDGNSQGCRMLHAAFAETNPRNHCPHISFDEMEDPKGVVKCQDPFGEWDPNELFSTYDIQFYNDFAGLNGIDPDIGYREVPTDGSGVDEDLLEWLWDISVVVATELGSWFGVR